MLNRWRQRRHQRANEARPRVLAAILADPARRHYGYEMSKELGIPRGYLYPALHGLLADGLIADGWEDDPGDRPPRRYYQAPMPGGQGQS